MCGKFFLRERALLLHARACTSGNNVRGNRTRNYARAHDSDDNEEGGYCDHKAQQWHTHTHMLTQVWVKSFICKFVYVCVCVRVIVIAEVVQTTR